MSVWDKIKTSLNSSKKDKNIFEQAGITIPKDGPSKLKPKELIEALEKMEKFSEKLILQNNESFEEIDILKQNLHLL